MAAPQWKGHLKLSLVSVPVKAYGANTDQGTIHFNQQPGQPEEGGQQIDVAGQRLATLAGRAVGVDDDQRHMGVGLIAHRPLAAQAPVSASHVPVVGSEYDHGVLPQVQVIQGVHEYLEAAVVVPDAVQVIVVIGTAPLLFPKTTNKRQAPKRQGLFKDCR
jgi:hypothetical protein